MSDTRIVLSVGKKNISTGRKGLRSESPEDNRYGFWGMVTELHPENHTVHVRTPEGRIVSNVRVLSSAWVTINADKGFLSGRRYMPPIDTHVLVFMPNGRFTSAVIIASGFSGDPQHADFKGDTDDEKEIDKTLLNSGWMYSEDNRTGTRTLQNKPEEPTIKLEIDQEEKGNEKVTLTIHGNVFTVDKENGVKIKTDKNIETQIDGDRKLTVGGGLMAKATGKLEMIADGAVALKSSRTELLEIGNAVATMGKMISDLLQACVSFKSVGSPATHTAPDFSIAAGQIKAQWDQVFK